MPEILAKSLGQPPHERPEPRHSAQRAHRNERLGPPRLSCGERAPRPAEEGSEPGGVGDATDEPTDHEENDGHRQQSEAEPPDGCPRHLALQSLQTGFYGPHRRHHGVGPVSHLLDLLSGLSDALSANLGHLGLEPGERLLDPGHRRLDRLGKASIEDLDGVLGQLVRVDDNAPTPVHRLCQVSRALGRRRELLLDPRHHRVRVQVRPAH